MPVSPSDRDYMRRLGEHEAQAHAERLAEHLALDLAERLRRSFAMMRRFAATRPTTERTDDPSPFYDRARQLGLYRP